MTKRYFVSFYSLITMLVFSSFGYAQNLQTSSTQQTHIQISAADEEFGQYWNLDEQEVKRYKRYMRLEGNFFYDKNVDPIAVLGMIESNPSKRKAYAMKWLAFERNRIESQRSFANLIATTSVEVYGKEKLVDFKSLPWNWAKTYDPKELMKGWKPPVKENVSTIQENITNKIEEKSELKQGDLLYLVIDANVCNNCQEAMSLLIKISNFLQVIVFDANNNVDNVKKWLDNAKVGKDIQQQGFIKVGDLNNVDWANFQPEPNTIYHVRNQKILKIMENLK